MITYSNSPQNTGHRIPIYFFVFNADNTLLKMLVIEKLCCSNKESLSLLKYMF